jgi:hypothetical protein
LNSVALERIGLLRHLESGGASAYVAAAKMPDVSGGVVDVDQDTGIPTGTVNHSRSVRRTGINLAPVALFADGRS